MGTFMLVALGLPVVALAWVGAAWVCTHLWAGVMVSLADAKNADASAQLVAQARAERARRGF